MSGLVTGFDEDIPKLEKGYQIPMTVLVSYSVVLLPYTPCITCSNVRRYRRRQNRIVETKKWVTILQSKYMKLHGTVLEI